MSSMKRIGALLDHTQEISWQFALPIRDRVSVINCSTSKLVFQDIIVTLSKASLGRGVARALGRKSIKTAAGLWR